ncbi:HNH endonuclease signature motif containing protein [Brevibacillus agri]|uniref:HNH endonuclease n=1 Tax=Brevibacillus agri TaxID=51101 RepID=UPI0025B6C368|nr:HNH endonuclease signature motif containing protein [Brevibacillus agri]MDN4093562.1 HNH endonuclease signature motif containing protein [Brevibacillus agri]
MALKKICNKSGCTSLVDPGQRDCDLHKQQEKMDKRVRDKQYDLHKRDKKAAAFYKSKEWLVIREQALIRDNYLCQDCLEEKRFRKADVVDHIKPIRWFWELRLVLSNLRSLCHKHHNQKTANDKRIYGG